MATNTANSSADSKVHSAGGIADDVHTALRKLGRSPAFTIFAVLILGLGIGANTAVFSLVNAVMLRPLPFVAPERLVTISDDLTAVGGPAGVNPALANYVDWKDRSRSFADMAALQVWSYNITGDGEPEQLTGVRTTANLFSLLGTQAVVGRTLLASDEAPDAGPVAVINETLWLRRFGGDSSLVGRTIRLDGVARTVVGVVPSDFQYPALDATVWLPASFTAEELASRDAHMLTVIARLADGVELGQAQAEMSAIAETLASEYPSANTGQGIELTPLQKEMAGGVRPTLFVLLAAAGAILLITCANVANLLLARGTSRRREFALRRALGAERGRIVRQLLTESSVLAVIGVAVGIALAIASFAYLAQLVPEALQKNFSLGFDWRVLAFTAGIGIFTVLLFGTGPSLAAARGATSLKLNDTSDRIAGTGGGRPLRALVVGEIALTIMLLSAAGLLLRSYVEVISADPGFEPENLLIVETALSPTRYGTGMDRTAFYHAVLERVEALPGVDAAGYANFPPLVFKGGRALLTIEGQAVSDDNFLKFITSDRVVSAEYLSTLGVPLIRGRHLDERDDAEGAPTAVVNEAMARLHWGATDPIGYRLKLGRADSETPWHTIVGVVGNVRQMGLDLPPEPEVYFPLEQSPIDAPFFWPRHLIVRTDGEPLALATAVRNAIWQVDPDQPVSNVRSMDELFASEVTNRNTQLRLVGVISALALVLASVGLYSVLGYAVAHRGTEIGIRIALGAQRSAVLVSVLAGAMRLSILGIVLGLIGSYASTRLLAAFLYGVSPTDPVTLGAVSSLILLVSAAAGWLPARRAASVDPVRALRSE